MASKPDFEVNAGLNIDDKSLNDAAKKIHAALSNAVKSAGLGVPRGFATTVAYGAQPTSYGSVVAQSHVERLLRSAEREALRSGNTEAAIRTGSAAMQVHQGINYGRRKLNQDVNFKAAQDNFVAAQERLAKAYDSGDRVAIKEAKRAALSAARTVSSSAFAGVEGYDATSKEALNVIKDLTKATKFNTAALVAVNSAVAAGLGFAGQALPSYWGQMATRNLFSARTAYNERVTAGGQAAGGVIGGVLGAAIGGALTSGMGGQIVGAQIGSSIGSLTGGLIGKSRQAEWESQQKSISDVQARFKALGLYRGAYSPTFGAAVGELGQASASDVEGMVGNSQTLAARMMFGQVSDNEMLLYSLMPNYFAAAMAGASDAELAAAYTRDLNALDPSLRLWVGSMVGGGSAGMVAFSQDKYSGGVLSRGSWYHGTDHVLVSYGGSYQAGSVERGALNAHAMEGQVRADLNKAAKAEASGTMEGIYSRVAPVPQMIMANGEMVSTNSKEYQDMVEAGVIGDPGKASGVRAFLQRNLNYVGIPTGWLGGRVDTKENMSIEAFESAAYAAQSGKKGKLAELDAQEEEWRKRHVTVVINNQIDGDTVSQKVIDIMGDETAVSNEISRFNLGGR